MPSDSFVADPEIGQSYSTPEYYNMIRLQNGFSAILNASSGKPRGFTSQEVTYARLARGVYDIDFEGIDGYLKRGKTFIDKLTGLQVALFVNVETGHNVLAFAGTSPTSWTNWKANLIQAYGFGSMQYSQGIAMAQELFSSTDRNIHFVGHSLGGGIASAAAVWTGGSATVFNAAGVHVNTLGGHAPTRGSVTHFHSSFDALRLGNALTPASVLGKQVSLGAAGFHGMDGVCQAMGC